MTEDPNPACSPTLFNVRNYGVKGDGIANDTIAINQAVEACARINGGQVHFLNFDAGAVLAGTTDLSQYQRQAVPEHLWEAQLGQWHRALIIGENLEDVAIIGQGGIDGSHVFDPDGEENMRGPHAIAFVNYKRFTFAANV